MLISRTNRTSTSKVPEEFQQGALPRWKTKPGLAANWRKADHNHLNEGTTPSHGLKDLCQAVSHLKPAVCGGFRTPEDGVWSLQQALEPE